MIVQNRTVSDYVCEKCDKTFDKEDTCKEHEESCDFDYLASIIRHDGKHTKKNSCMDCFEFWRMCAVGSSWSINHHVWLYVNRQYTIAQNKKTTTHYQFGSNNNYVKDCESYRIMNRIINKEYFKFDETGEKMANVVCFKTKSLHKCKLTARYADGKELTYDYTADLKEEHEIPLYADNRLVSIVLEDVKIDPEKIKQEGYQNTCTSKCPHIDGMWVGSHSCKYACPNFAGNYGDYSGPVLCNYKSNHGE